MHLHSLEYRHTRESWLAERIFCSGNSNQANSQGLGAKNEQTNETIMGVSCKNCQSERNLVDKWLLYEIINSFRAGTMYYVFDYLQHM